MPQFRGTGDVIKDGREVARISYYLTKITDEIDTGRGVVKGQSSTTGLVTTLSGYLEVGDLYTLRLDTGVEVQFYATHTDDASDPNATYTVAVNGDPEA